MHSAFFRQFLSPHRRNLLLQLVGGRHCYSNCIAVADARPQYNRRQTHNTRVCLCVCVCMCEAVLCPETSEGCSGDTQHLFFCLSAPDITGRQRNPTAVRALNFIQSHFISVSDRKRFTRRSIFSHLRWQLTNVPLSWWAAGYVGHYAVGCLCVWT